VNSARSRVCRRGDNSSTSFRNVRAVSASMTRCSGPAEGSATVSGAVLVRAGARLVWRKMCRHSRRAVVASHPPSFSGKLHPVGVFGQSQPGCLHCIKCVSVLQSK
jgi:hypothetical protein